MTKMGVTQADGGCLVCWNKPVTPAAQLPGGPQGGCNPFPPYCWEVTL